MRMSAQGAPEVDAFDAAREELEATIGELRERGACPHTEVIAALRRRGAEVQRRLLQAWMDRLFELERTETALWPRPAGSEVRVRARRLETDFGRITVKRHGYALAGEPSAAFPMDGVLNLPEEIYALSLRRRVAEEAVGESFDAAVDSVDRTTSGHVPKRQSEELVVRAARDFDAFYETRPQAANDTLGPRALQVMSCDSKGVTMRPEALRDATRKEAEAAKTQAVRGDPMAARKLRRHDKRMAITTAVWEQERHPREASDIVASLRRAPHAAKPKKKAPRPQNKRVAASLEKSQAKGIAEMFDEAHRRNPGGARENVVLVDGEVRQLEVIEAEAKSREMPVRIVLDVIHVIHYLWLIAMVLCRKDEREAEARTTHLLVQMLSMHPLDVIAAIRQVATHRDLTKGERDTLENHLNYLAKNSIYVHYANFLRDGLPIATGVIEGACRHLIQDRLGITGARWGLSGAEAILKLRALRSSGDWDAYWRFHENRERERNHPIPPLAA
jgi:hypothetical protein